MKGNQDERPRRVCTQRPVSEIDPRSGSKSDDARRSRTTSCGQARTVTNAGDRIGQGTSDLDVVGHVLRGRVAHVARR